MKQPTRIRLIKALIDINEKIFFERRLEKAYKRLLNKPLDVVIDVGANKGQTIDFFKKLNKACKIFAFEPNKDLFKKLSAKYKNNPSIKLFNVGVSDTVGKKTFYQNVLDYTSTFEELNYDSVYLEKKAKILGVKPEEIVEDSYEVETITLSHFMNTELPSKIDLLKIDVEGHEHACLAGLFNGSQRFYNIKFVQLEKHNDDMYSKNEPFGAIEVLLKQNGFDIASIVKHGFGNIEEVIFINSNFVG